MTDPHTADADPTLNRVTWWEIPVSDLDAAQAFYGSVFDWAFTPFGDGFVMAQVGGEYIGGLHTGSAPGGEGVRIYVNVGDLERTLRRISGAGGTVHHERTEISPEMGWWADFTDPDGNRIGLCSSVPPRG